MGDLRATFNTGSAPGSRSDSSRFPSGTMEMPTAIADDAEISHQKMREIDEADRGADLAGTFILCAGVSR
jgi:hypothetical protein